MTESKPYEHARTWMSGEYQAEGLQLTRAIIEEGLSKLTEMTVLFTCNKRKLDLEKIVGRDMRVHLMTENDKERMFTGICISVESIGYRDGFSLYSAEVRPWFWLLTRNRDCRIFQDKTAVEIIKEIFSDHGMSDYRLELTDNYLKRTYCVQYRESDYDFICRLMEEEGIYFFFSNDMDSTKTEELVICDSVSAHSPVRNHERINYHARQKSRGAETSREDHIAEWVAKENMVTNFVTLNDYDFLSPTADLRVSNAIPKGSHSHTKTGFYDYPGHYRKDVDRGDKQSRVRIEAEAVSHATYEGAGNVRALGVGQTFFLEDHPDTSNAFGNLVISARHYVQDMNYFKESEGRYDLPALRREFPEAMKKDGYACTFETIPKLEQYRAPLVTPWPEIPGLQTATVVGKSGEEIWTDEHGRIKVQFHWDRRAKLDKLEERSSCWVRVVTPWSGTGWGMVALPRVGQEVVIQFEEGDPDRPICTGMLYNEPKKPAFKYPDDATQLGIRTRSSKGGGEQDYNELMFEDKKGSELMRVQAQKDHQELIKNKSAVTIGLDKHELVDAEGKIKSDVKDGSLSEVIKQNVTRVIKDGDDTFTIENGSRTQTIAKGDETLKIEKGSQTLEIKSDKTQKIEGKHTKTITGNDATTVKTGNMTVDVKSGKITMTAAQKIELKVGGSTVTIDPMSVTIKTTMLKFEAKAMAELKSTMTTVKGDAMLTLKGGLTMIN